MADVQQMIEAHIPRLRRYARALVRDVAGADDLVQECLTRALTKRDLWQDGTDLRAWLFTILHNQYVNQIRRSIRVATIVGVDDAAPSLSQPASQDKRLELRDLDRALGLLAAEQRAVILLVGLEGMPYAEVGELLGVPVGTVRSRLSRGRQTLRRLMDMETDQHGEPQPTRTIARRTALPPAGSRHPSLADRRLGRLRQAAGRLNDRKCINYPRRHSALPRVS